VISILISAGLLFAQPAARPPRSRVEGTVVNAASGEGVRNAIVILRSQDEAAGISYADETDGNGHFAIDDVQPGEYSILAERQGFVFLPPGARGAPAPSLKVQPGEQVKDAQIRLTPLGVIAGRVLDSDGDPVRGATVSAFVYRYTNGKRAQRNVEQVQTNENGQFRLFGLRAGTYYLQASRQPGLRYGAVVAPGPNLETAPTFYPGTTDAEHAAAVELRTGAELSGIDIRLQSPAATYSVRFKLPAGEAAAGNVNYRPMIFPHSADRLAG